jgi:hypothetical protein
MRRLIVIALVVVAVAAAGLGAGSFAQGTQDLGSGAITAALTQSVGKRAKIKLVSGQDLEGQVAQVGSHAVALTGLTGMEFYNATIRLDQVAAVIVRAPGK